MKQRKTASLDENKFDEIEADDGPQEDV
jgi:hypothetical protein